VRQAGWTCQDGLCRGPKDCPAISCKPAAGGQYCGIVGDGCRPRGRLRHGLLNRWRQRRLGVRQQRNVCVGGPACQRISCNPAEGGNTAETLATGVAATLSCPTACPDARPAMRPHVCSCDKLCANRVTCDGGGHDQHQWHGVRSGGLESALQRDRVHTEMRRWDPVSAGAATCPVCDAEVSGQPIASGQDRCGRTLCPRKRPPGVLISRWSCSSESGGVRSRHRRDGHPPMCGQPDCGAPPVALLRLPKKHP